MFISHTHKEPSTEELGITRVSITVPLVIIGVITVLIAVVILV